MTHTRSLALSIALAVLTLTGCKSSEPPSEAPAAETQPIDVYLLPVGDFPRERAERLARELSSDAGVHVRASLPMGTAELRPLPSGDQIAAEDIISGARVVGSRLPARSTRSIVVALTTLDINERAQSLRFVFGRNDIEGRTSVLSTARMGFSTPTVEATPEQVYVRLYKMTKRAIGEQYFGFARSTDIGNVLYAPIMSLEGIDAMGTSFPQQSLAKQTDALPPPPQGYTWQQVPAIRAAVLVPDGWHFSEEHQGTTHAVFVTREEIRSGPFEVGLTVNAFLGDPNAPARVKRILDGVSARYSAEQSRSAQGPFATLSCQFSSPREDGREPVVTFMLALVNTRTRTTYLVWFESPESEWQKSWRLGRPILDSLALETEI